MSNESKLVVFRPQNGIVCFTYEGGYFYYTISGQEVRGGFYEEREAYQEALTELSNILCLTLDMIDNVEDKVKEIIVSINGNDTIRK